VADELLSFSAQIWVVTREVVPTSSTYLAWLSTSCCPPFSPEVLAGSALLQRRLAGRRRWSDRATRACTGGEGRGLGSNGFARRDVVGVERCSPHVVAATTREAGSSEDT
jgi:hypothetical protein